MKNNTEDKDFLADFSDVIEQAKTINNARNTVINNIAKKLQILFDQLSEVGIDFQNGEGKEIYSFEFDFTPKNGIITMYWVEDDN